MPHTVDDTCPPCCTFGKKFECGCKDQGSFVNDPLACPLIHNNTRITPGGPKYHLYCATQTHRAGITIKQANDFIQCVDMCGATPGCMGVDYDRSSKKCYLKSELLSKDDPAIPNKQVDSSTMVADELKSDEKCPELNSQVRLVDKFPFKIFCALALLGDNLPGSPIKVPTLAECAKRCVDNSKCQGADYNYLNGQCSLKVNYLSAPTAPKTHGIAVVPLAKRGAYIIRDL